MKHLKITRWLLLAVVLAAAAALATSAALARSGSIAPAHPAGPSAGLSAAQPAGAILSGGHYRLSGISAGQALDLASGGGYHLKAPAALPTGSGCCCLFLPCVRR